MKNMHIVKKIKEKSKGQDNQPGKAEVERISEYYRNMILDKDKKKAIHISSEDYKNLINISKYAEFGRSTAIQAAFCLGYAAKNEDMLEMKDKISESDVKLELVGTVLDILIQMVNIEEADVLKKVGTFANYQRAINDVLHIALEGLHYSAEILSGVNRGDLCKKKEKGSAK